MQCAEILKISCGENCEPTGKVRILIRTEIRILPVSTSADPHIRILPPAPNANTFNSGSGPALRKINQIRSARWLWTILPSANIGWGNTSQLINVPRISFDQLCVQEFFNFFFLSFKLLRNNAITIYRSRRHLVVTMQLHVVKDVSRSIIIAQIGPSP